MYQVARVSWSYSARSCVKPERCGNLNSVAVGTFVRSSNQVNHAVAVDTSLDPPVYITRVYTAMEDGAYGVGEAILVTVVFSAPVNFLLNCRRHTRVLRCCTREAQNHESG